MSELIHDPLLDARESIPTDNLPDWMDEACLKADLSSNWLNANQELDMPEYMLSWNNVGFFPLGSINAITGHKKNGKTMFETLMMVAVLKDGQPLGPLKYELHDTKPNPKVLFIDTEQEMAYSLMVQRRVHYLMGWDFRTNNERFKVLWLHNELSTKERWQKMCYAIWTMKPDIIFLDGCRDMIDDINKAEESTTFIRQTMNIATYSNGVITQALHYNPGSEKMRGWLGTELGNRVAYSVELNKDHKPEFTKFTAKFVDCRGKDVDDLEFYVDDTRMKFGIPALMDESTVAQELDRRIQEQDKADVREKVAFMGEKQYKYWTIVKKMRDLHHLGSDRAQTYVSDAVKYEIITHLGDNLYKYNPPQVEPQVAPQTDEADKPF